MSIKWSGLKWLGLKKKKKLVEDPHLWPGLNRPWWLNYMEKLNGQAKIIIVIEHARILNVKLSYENIND